MSPKEPRFTGWLVFLIVIIANGIILAVVLLIGMLLEGLIK